MKIIMTYHGPGLRYSAKEETDPITTYFGSTPAEALGEVVAAHAAQLGITVEHVDAPGVVNQTGLK